MKNKRRVQNGSGKKAKIVSISMYEPMLSTLKILASKNNTTISAVIRECINGSIQDLYPDWRKILLRERKRQAQEKKLLPIEDFSYEDKLRG